MKRNWFFGVMLLCIAIIFSRRYVSFNVPVVSQPDSWVLFSTQNEVLEQTWQPEVKEISGVSIACYAANDFTCDVKMTVYSDDYSETLAEALLENCSFTAEETGNLNFRFERTALIQGERYRIQLSFSNASTEGILQVSSGSNYGGGQISGEETGRGFAFNITCCKYSKLFWMMAVLFPLLAYSLLLMTITGKKWEETVGLSLFLEGIILYCFGCAEHLVWGISAVYVLAAISMLLTIILFNVKKKDPGTLLSPGLWIYFIMFILIVIVNNGDWLGYRDELRHWGIAVRDMFYYDSFAKHAGTTVILPRYLPFAPMIEYLFVYMNGMFNESILFIAYQTMLLSALIILCGLLRGKKGKKLAFPVAATMICVPVIFFNNISNSIMVDSLLAAIGAYILICYFSDEGTWFNRARIVCALTALTLIKDMGLILAGLTVLIMFGDMLLMQIKERKLNIKKLLFPVMCGFLALGVYFSWQIYLSIPAKNIFETAKTVETSESARDASEAAEVPEVSEAEDIMEAAGTEENAETENRPVKAGAVSNAIHASNITPEGILNVLKGQGEEYQYLVTRNLLMELFDGETYSFGIFSVSFVDLLCIIAFAIFSMSYFGYWQSDRTRMNVFAGLFLAVSICLCVFLQVIYWFSFSLYEALELTSFSRYLAPYACTVLITTLYLVWERAYREGNGTAGAKYMVSALAFFLVVSMPTGGIVVEGKDIEGNTTPEITCGHNEIREILRSVARRGERALFICSNSDGYSEYVFRNAVCPIFSEHDYWNTVSSQELYLEQYELYGKENIDDNAAYVFTVEEWKEEVRKCQYMVVFHSDELFRRSYAEVLDDLEEIEDGSVYRVMLDGDDISFRLIGRTGIRAWH